MSPDPGLTMWPRGFLSVTSRLRIPWQGPGHLHALSPLASNSEFCRGDYSTTFMVADRRNLEEATTANRHLAYLRKVPELLACAAFE